MLILFLAQAVAGPVLPATPRPRRDMPCPVDADTDDVIVCARDPDAYRLHPVPERFRRGGLPEARIHLGSTALAAETEAAGLPGGVPINRIMFRLKIPLGAKRGRADP